MKKTLRSTANIWLPLLAGSLMLAVPLLRDLHIESALLVSLFGCFWAGWLASRENESKHEGRRIRVIFQTLYLAGLPLFIYAIITGCLSWHGIGFWILYPVPSVFFGYSIGRLFSIWELPARRLCTITVLLFIAVGILLVEFFNLPQVYFFNHVWGGWPGPIYDETVKVGWNLVFFRTLTLAWIGLLWFLPAYQQSPKAKAVVIVCFLGLIAGYTQLAERGGISPRSYLQEQLGGVKETLHFVLHYDEEHYTADEIGFIAQKHEFYFRQISRRLDINRDQKAGKIESYLYAHPWQKKRLVGAKFTSYVPVWLDQDQLHIAKQQVEGSLKHELVHVLAKQFGNRLFNASWSIGLIEGLAVAVAPDVSAKSTINQIVVSDDKTYPTAQEMQNALSLQGFYGGRSNVNYTESGSFVQYLLNQYPIGSFKRAYQKADLAAAYRVSLDSLVNGWHRALDTVSVDSIDRQESDRLYGFLSLFEQQCPHVESPFAEQWDRYRFYLSVDDTLHALQHLDAALAEAPENPLVKSRWAYLHLKRGYYKKVEQKAAVADTAVESLLLYADAFAMDQKWSSAQNYILKAAQHLQEQPDSVLQQALQMRQDSTQWEYYLKLIYQSKTFDDSIFVFLHPRTQARAIHQAINRQDWQKLKRYGRLLGDRQKKTVYIGAYLKLMEWEAYSGDYTYLDRWIKSLKSLEMRPRYLERLDETTKWIYFQKNGRLE